jgi:hypothetical protein
MEKNFNTETWRGFLEKSSSYKESVSSFCKENNISKSQFYYYKKRFEKSEKPIFHAMALKKEETATKTAHNVKRHIKIYK